MAQSEPSSPHGSSSGRVLLYWLIVGIPLTWGVAQSVNAALPLFGGKSAYIPWVIGAPPAKPAASSDADTAENPLPSPTLTATVMPRTTPTPAPTEIPTPAASPFSTAQPSATVAPIVTPAPPTT